VRGTVFVSAAVVICFFSSCVTGEKMSRLHADMTKNQVIAVLGQPDGYKQLEGHEIFRYSNRLSTGWSWDRADYNVIFKDGRVVEYGAGEVRPKGNGVIVIVPLR